MYDDIPIRLYEVFETDSTQIVAKKLIKRSNAQDVVVIFAHKQNRGYGRKGRQFFSEGGVYCSIILPKNILDGVYIKQLFLSPIAVSKYLESLGIDEKGIKFKWPNDIIYDNKKISGILVENHESYLIIGIGINIKPVPDFNYPTVSVNDIIDTKIDLRYAVQFITSFIVKQRNCLWSEIRIRWLNQAYKLGENIVIDDLQGRFIGINKDNGHLILNTHNGDTEIDTGDIMINIDEN